MTTDSWRVFSDGRPLGEFPEYPLVQWAAGGRVDPDDLFWRSGMTVAAPPPRLGDDPTLSWILPVGRSPWAIAAGYLGLFSRSRRFGPLAVLAGLLAIRQISKSPRLHGMGRVVFGIVAGSLGTLGLVAVLTSR